MILLAGVRVCFAGRGVSCSTHFLSVGCYIDQQKSRGDPIKKKVKVYAGKKYSGAAKTHTAEQHGSLQRGSRGSSHNQGPAVACDLLLAS
jgi:hypothetical protein